MLEERRQFPRLVPSTPLFVSMDDAKSGLLLDLCEGGLAVASLVPRNLDDVVSLAFDLPEGVGHIEARARIAWTRDSGHLTGVRFMDLDDVAQQQLSEWIAAGTNLRPAGTEEIEEPVIVTRSTYAQVDAIRREARPEIRMETQPQIEMRPLETRVEEPIAAAMNLDTVTESDAVEIAETAIPATTTPTSMEMTGSLFPERAVEEHILDAGTTNVELAEPVEASSPNESAIVSEIAETPMAGEMAEMAEAASEIADAATAESADTEESKPVTPGSTSRAEWVEHVAQMEDVPEESRFDSGNQTLPADAETVGWASDAVGWVTEVADRRITAPEEAEFDGVFIPEMAMGAKPSRSTKSRYTIELVLAVVLLTWALVFLGYQMGSTGASRVTHDPTMPKGIGASAPGSAGAKGDTGKLGAPSAASFASAEAFPEINPISPVNSGRTSASASNSAALETPVPAPNRSASVAATPKASGSAATAREITGSASGTTVLAGPVTTVNSGLVLQVGAMKMQGNATALMQDLRKKKFSAFVYQHGKDNLYRVAVGPFGDRDSSAKVKSELEKNGYKTITAKWVKD